LRANILSDFKAAGGKLIAKLLHDWIEAGMLKFILHEKILR